MFHEKMTLLFGETPISDFDWLESAISLPGIGGLLHAYSGGSAGAPAGGCPEKQGPETGLVPGRVLWRRQNKGAVTGGHFNLRLPVFPGSTTTFLQKATTQFSESVISALDLPYGAVSCSGNDPI
jgi:hypothetical protein